MHVDPNLNGHNADDLNWTHLGYYVRRENGELVLVQTFLVERPDDVQAAATDIRTFHIDPNELEPDWAEEVLIQGAHLAEGKSCEFFPPDE